MWDAVTGLIGLAKTSPIKLALILAIVSAVVGFVVWYDKSRYDAGYNAAMVKYLEEVNRAEREAEELLEASLEELQGKLVKKQTEADSQRDKAIKLQQQLDKRPVIEVVHEIESIEYSCNSMGDEFVRVLGNIVGEAPNTSP